MRKLYRLYYRLGWELMIVIAIHAWLNCLQLTSATVYAWVSFAWVSMLGMLLLFIVTATLPDWTDIPLTDIPLTEVSGPHKSLWRRGGKESGLIGAWEGVEGLQLPRAAWEGLGDLDTLGCHLGSFYFLETMGKWSEFRNQISVAATILSGPWGCTFYILWGLEAGHFISSPNYFNYLD